MDDRRFSEDQDFARSQMYVSSTIQKGPPSVVISGEASNPKKGGPFLGSMPNSAITTELVCYNSPLITFTK
jgi:hypothetical protein